MTDRPTGAVLEVIEAVPLGQVLVDRVARDVGARVLAIKGAVPASFGLRTERHSVDVDALVAPADFESVQDRLIQLGWLSISGEDSARSLPSHSDTLAHPAWPVTIDLHHGFPGFLADAGKVFDVLWEERVLVRIAGQDVAATGLAGATVVAALHALRSPEQARNVRELDGLISAWDAGSFGAEDRARLAALADRTGAAQVVAPFLARIGMPVAQPVDRATTQALAEWRVSSQARETRGLGWLLALRRSQVSDWPGILRRAVLPDDDAVLRHYGARPDGSRRWRARLRRILTGLGDLPRSLRILWHERRALARIDDERRPGPRGPER
ncbi:MAG: nucleotidyltransferase family protein [Propionibacteriales bacterium]|nr:nucleotidyltransferase family protein [Propionibacteriales bacterium]